MLRMLSLPLLGPIGYLHPLERVGRDEADPHAQGDHRQREREHDFSRDHVGEQERVIGDRSKELPIGERRRQRHIDKKDEWTLRRERLLLEAGDRFGLDPKAIIEKPLSSTAVSVGSKYLGLSPVMLSAWRGSSGAAHGRTWATLALSDHDPIPGTETELGASDWSTSNTPSLVSLLFVGVAAHEALEVGYTAMLEGRTADLQKDTELAIARVYTECRIGEDAP